MKLRLSTNVALAAALIAGGCAMAGERQPAQSAAADRQCFLASRVNGFDALDDDTVRVRVGTREVYELDILGTCPDIDWSLSVGLRSTGGSSWICRGHDAELLVPSAAPGRVDRCPVLGVRRLSEAEVEALRQRR